VISGIVFVIRNGLRWRDAPREYGPHKTVYNRFVRWSRLGHFRSTSITGHRLTAAACPKSAAMAGHYGRRVDARAALSNSSRRPACPSRASEY
jgi:hypothetical protein